MILRILLFVVAFGLLYYVINMIVTQLTINKCTYCDGQGYWKGTRGEKNVCKACDGSGRKN